MMGGDRLLGGEDAVTDDLLHLVADHMRDASKPDCIDDDVFTDDDDFTYNFTDGPVKPPRNWSTTKFQVIVYCLFKGVGEAYRYLLLNDIKVTNKLCEQEMQLFSGHFEC